MSRKSLISAGIALLVLLVLYAAAGFLLAPWLFQRYVPPYLQQKLERDVTVGEVRVNPFLLNMELRDVVIEGRHGSPVFAADRLFADLAITGLFRRAWTVDELSFEGLRAHLVLERDGSLNVVEMVGQLSSEEATPDRQAPALIVRQLSVPAARLVFTDLTGEKPASVTLEPLELQAAGLSTEPQRRGSHQLTARVPGGGGLHWRGEVGLAPVLVATGELKVTGLSASTVWPFVRDELLLSQLQATASLSARYVYDARTSLQLEGVAAELSDVLLARPGVQRPLLTMERIAAEGGSFDLAQRAGSVATLALRSGSAVVAVAPDGVLNWATLIAPMGSDARDDAKAVDAGAPPAQPSSPANASDAGSGAAQAGAGGATVALDTAGAPDPRETGAGESKPGRAAGPLATSGSAQNSVSAVVSTSAASAPPGTGAASPGWEFAIGSLQLSQVELQYLDQARSQPLVLAIGEVEGQAELALTGGELTQVVASGVDARLERASLSAAGAEEAALTLASAQVQQGRFDLQGKRLAAQQLSLQGGQAELVRRQGGGIPLLDLLRLAPAPAPAAGKTGKTGGRPTHGEGIDWRYDIAKLSVESFDLALQDRSFEPAVAYDLQLQSLTASNVASASNAPTPFQAALRVQQGGTLEVSGTVAPDGGVLKAQVKVDQLALAPLQPVARRYTGLDIQADALTLAADVLYDPGDGGQPQIAVDGLSATLPGVTVRRPGSEQPLLALQRIEANGGRFDLARRDIALGRLLLQDGQVNATVQAQGQLNWLADASSRKPASAPAGGDARPWNVLLEDLRVQGVGAHYADRSRSTPLVLDVETVSGNLELAVTAGGARTQVIAQGLEAQVRQLALRAGASSRPAVALASGSIAQGHLNLAEQTVSAREVVLAGGGTRVVQESDGTIPLLALFESGQDGAAQPEAPSDASARAGEWRYAVDTLRVDSFALEFADRGFEPPLSLGATLQASIQHLASDKRASFSAALAIDQGGTIKAQGSAAPGAESVQAQVEASQVALSPLRPLLRRFAALALETGALSASAQLRYQRGDGSGALQADGTLRITDLLMNEAWSGDRLLAWKQLDAEGVSFDLAERQLTVKDVTVLEPGAKIVISKDRDVNLARVAKPEGESRAADEGQARQVVPQQEQAAAPKDAAGFQFRVERVRLREGVVDYADLSLVLPFSTKVTGVNGTIVGISSDPSRRAEVKATGAIQPYGSAKVEGSIAMWEPRHFTDLQVEFNNVLVPPLSPYTATFAGRKVESGKLWLDLDYKVQDSTLLGKNEIRLADFTLGEKVGAAHVLDVPLNLAVALLTDSKGEIKLSVPVRGDLDNPRFSVASALKQAVGNVIRRVVSAPFRALGRLVGRDAGSLAAIDFEPGSARLAPEQREKLDALTRALSARPRLQLVVSAPYDPQRDTGVLQRDAARRQLAQALGRQIPHGEDPGPISYDDPATHRALEQLLVQQKGADALTELRGKSDGGAEPSERELYQAMFAQIASAQPLEGSSAQVLATERARAIASYLQQQGVEPGRVQTGRIAPVQAGNKGPVRAQLQIAADGSAG
jgi:hypothetical protein